MAILEVHLPTTLTVDSLAAELAQHDTQARDRLQKSSLLSAMHTTKSWQTSTGC